MALLSRLNRLLSRFGLIAAVIGLWTIVGLVAWQVFGRYRRVRRQLWKHP